MATTKNGNQNSAEVPQIIPTEKQTNLQKICNNFATPLMGQFLNLPRDPALIECPACGIKEISQVEDDIQWWAQQINSAFGCLFISLCCCCCLDYYKYRNPIKNSDRNHYCKNCGCYFGRFLEHKQIKISKKK